MRVSIVIGLVWVFGVGIWCGFQFQFTQQQQQQLPSPTRNLEVYNYKRSTCNWNYTQSNAVIENDYPWIETYPLFKAFYVLSSALEGYDDWFIWHGSLLGMYRDRSIMPHDYDLDLYVGDLSKVCTLLRNYIAKIGYNYKVYCGNSVQLQHVGCGYGFYHIDIFGKETIQAEPRTPDVPWVKNNLDELLKKALCKCCLFDICMNCLDEPYVNILLEITFANYTKRVVYKKQYTHKHRCMDGIKINV